MLLVATLLLAPILTLPGADAKVQTLYTHVFARGIDTSGSSWRPVNVTDVFYQEETVFAFANASFPTKTKFVWAWYDPSGSVYMTENATWQCRRVCDFYSTLPAKSDRKVGEWRMDLYADGVLLYSDRFKIMPNIFWAYSWTFDVVSLDVTHVRWVISVRSHREEWDEYSNSFPSYLQVSNFAAYDYDTSKPLFVLDYKEGSTTNVRVSFHSPKGYGYRFVLTFDIAKPLRAVWETSGRVYGLVWDWYGRYAIPQNVTVILPSGYEVVRFEGVAASWTRSIEAGRVAVSFSGTSPPDGPFSWTVVFRPVPKTTSTQSLSSTRAETVSVFSSDLSMILIGVVVGVVVTAGLFLGYRNLRKKTRISPNEQAPH